MHQPAALKSRSPWIWSPGAGVDVWAMFVACAAGDLATVQRLVASDPSLVRSHYEYRTPLSFAVRENRVEVARFLLDHGAEPLALGDVLQMARDRDYQDMASLLEEKLGAIHGASSAGEAVAAAIRDRDLTHVRQLLDDAPALVHAGDARSNQPIHWATMTRQMPVIDELLARGADINARRSDEARPILLTNGDYHYRGWRDVPADVTTTPDEVYRHLVAMGAEVPIGMAALKGDVARVRQLVERDPAIVNRCDDHTSYYAGGGAPLKNAVLGGQIDIVRYLLDRGADPNLPEETIAPHGHALYAAVYHQHDAIAKLLLEHGAYPNPEVESSADAVWIAIRQGRLDAVALLSSYGATWRIPIDLEGAVSYEQIVSTGLRREMNVLARFGDVDTAETLLAADPSLADSPEALEEAARHGHDAFVHLLLRHQPDLARRVTVARPRATAEFLFTHGMDPNRRAWLGRTPLHEHAQHGRVEEAALFLDHGADIDAREDESRSTPLALAAREGHVRMVEFLLRRGAKPTLQDDPPWATPRAWATKRGRAEVLQLLDAFESPAGLPARSVERYEAIAQDLADAYGPGDPAALERVLAFFRIDRPDGWEPRTNDMMVTELRRQVRRRLGNRRTEDTSESSLSIEDARWLVAQQEGYGSWADLVSAV